MTDSPSKGDLEWTQSTIEGRVVWAIPSVGCVLLFDHTARDYKLFMKAEHNELELVNLERIESTLVELGYSQGEAHLVGGAQTAVDVVQMLKILTHTMSEREDLSQFWKTVQEELGP